MSRIEEIRARVDNDAKVAEMCGQAQWVRRIDDIRFLLAERDRLAAEVDRVAGERMSVLSELSKVAFKLGTTEAHLDAARGALETIAGIDMEAVEKTELKWPDEIAQRGDCSCPGYARRTLHRMMEEAQ